MQIATVNRVRPAKLKITLHASFSCLSASWGKRGILRLGVDINATRYYSVLTEHPGAVIKLHIGTN